MLPLLFVSLVLVVTWPVHGVTAQLIDSTAFAKHSYTVAIEDIAGEAAGKCREGEET